MALQTPKPLAAAQLPFLRRSESKLDDDRILVLGGDEGHYKTGAS